MPSIVLVVVLVVVLGRLLSCCHSERSEESHPLRVNFVKHLNDEILRMLCSIRPLRSE